MPAAATDVRAGGDATVTYHHTDLVDTITQGSLTSDYTLDVNGNASDPGQSWTDNASGSPVTDPSYDGGDDNPALTQDIATCDTRVFRPGATAQRRHVELEIARAPEIARLSAALMPMAVKLTLV